MSAQDRGTETPTASASSWADEGGNLVRAVAGGLLFGIPLLFTLEVWGIGSSATPPDMAMALLVTFVPVSLLVHTSGFRRAMALSLPGILREAAESIAIGVVAVTGVLVLLREITLRTPIADALARSCTRPPRSPSAPQSAAISFNQSPDETDGDSRPSPVIG